MTVTPAVRSPAERIDDIKGLLLEIVEEGNTAAQAIIAIIDAVEAETPVDKMQLSTARETTQELFPLLGMVLSSVNDLQEDLQRIQQWTSSRQAS
ncbi:MAG: hypothetical protein ACXV48_08150 [Halobacteriota archaeon]